MFLSDFLNNFDTVEDDRDGVLVHCPAHSDSSASLRVSVSDAGKVLIKCRAGCPTHKVLGALGLGMAALMRMEVDAFNFSTATSSDKPASPADVARLAVSLDEWAASLCDGSEASREALAYAERRFGLNEQDCARLGLGYAPKAVYNDNRELVSGLPGGPRLVVPFRDAQGVARGYQARSLADDAKVRWYGPESPEGASWSRIAVLRGDSRWDEVLITEGPGDSLTGVGLGYDTIGVRGAGLASNESVVDEVAAVLGDRLAVICGDGDPAGRQFASTFAQGLLKRGARVKILPVPDTLDLTDWRKRDGDRFATEIIRKVMDTPEEVAADVILRDRDLDRYPFTDLGNARFARDYIAASGSGVKFTPEAGYFLLRGGVWAQDKLDRTRAYVQEAGDRTALIATRLASQAGPSKEEQAEAKAWLSWAKYCQSSKGISASLKELQALPEVATEIEDFDKHPDLLACENGVINLRTGELLPHDSSLLLTRKVAHKYRPEVRAPRWEQFLVEVMPKYPDLPAYLQRLMGYGITGRVDEQCFAVLYGTGANGKSVFTDTLTEVFRDVTTTTPFSTFEDRGSGGVPNDIAALKGSRLVMAAEGEQGRPMAEAVLKRITGRDMIAARFMRREFFEFKPTFLLSLATNFKPKFKGQDEGLWRRVKLIPWDRYFAPHERDHGLADALLDEAEGILTWAVEGARQWYANGLQDPDVVRDATKEYRQTSDALAGFLPGLMVADASAPRFDGGDLYRHYLEWADEENLPLKERWTRQAFYGALEERGFMRKKTNKGVAFEGIRRRRLSDPLEDESPAENSSAPERADQAPLADYQVESPSPVQQAAPTRGPSLNDLDL